MYEYMTVIGSVADISGQTDVERRLRVFYADGWQPVWQALRGGVAMVTLVKDVGEMPQVKNQMLCNVEECNASGRDH